MEEHQPPTRSSEGGNIYALDVPTDELVEELRSIEQPPQPEDLSSTPEPKRSNNAASCLPATRFRGTRPSASIGTLRSNIASTKQQLSTVLQQICKLDSYSSRSDMTTPSASLSRENQTGGAKSPPPTVCNDIDVEAALDHANAIVSRHISLLKEYNDIKDIAMGMLSLIADKEGRRLVEVMEERELSEQD